MSFSPVFYALQQEGFIIRSCIYTGLTELRNANIGEKGRYYTAFFQLAIALERLAKLGLILDYMESHGLAAPGDRAVRHFGHDIVTLYRAAEGIAQAREYEFFQRLDPSSIETRILNFLSTFAEGTRYANLDTLASGSAATNDPLAEWHRILAEIVRAHVPQSRLVRIQSQSRAIAQLISEYVMARADDLANQPLLLQDWLAAPQLYSLGARYATWHCFKLFVPLGKLVCKLSRGAALREPPTEIVYIPEMSDFFGFLWADREIILRKKRWP
jgi:hypothetical protein